MDFALLSSMVFDAADAITRLAQLGLKVEYQRWSRLSEQRCRFDKWNRAAVR